MDGSHTIERVETSPSTSNRLRKVGGLSSAARMPLPATTSARAGPSSSWLIVTVLLCASPAELRSDHRADGPAEAGASTPSPIAQTLLVTISNGVTGMMAR